MVRLLHDTYIVQKLWSEMTKQPNKTKRERRSTRNICRHSDTHTYVYRGIRSKYLKREAYGERWVDRYSEELNVEKNDLT